MTPRLLSPVLRAFSAFFIGMVILSCSALPKSTTVSVPENGQVYLSLETGRVHGDPAGAWDLALGYNGTVYTNSGSTAEYLRTGGQGGAWDYGVGDIGSVSVTDIGQEVLERAGTPDQRSWVQVYYEDEPYGEPAEMTLNAFMYLGYRGGDGTADNPLRDYMEYNSASYYRYEFASHSVFLTDRLYVVRHANGQDHSLVQISGREASYPNRTYTLRFKNL